MKSTICATSVIMGTPDTQNMGETQFLSPLLTKEEMMQMESLANFCRQEDNASNQSFLESRVVSIPFPIDEDEPDEFLVIPSR